PDGGICYVPWGHGGAGICLLYYGCGCGRSSCRFGHPYGFVQQVKNNRHRYTQQAEMVGNDWIWIIPLLPLAGFITISLLNKRLPHAAVSVLAPGVVLLAFLLAVRVFFWLLSDPNIVLSTTALTWFSSGGFSVSFSLIDRKSTRLNSSHVTISYAVFCLKK